MRKAAESNQIDVLGTSKLSTSDYEILKEIIQLYEYHPSIILIRNQIINQNTENFPFNQ